jgi:single-strand DNA-binding protein
MLNKVILSGRICSDIEVKVTPTEVNVCSFRIAVNRRFKNAEGNYDADFISCVAWRGQADFLGKYFEKGDPIEIVGRIETRDYEKDGHKVYITEVVCDEVGFALSKKTDGQGNASFTPATESAVGFAGTSDEFITVNDDDLPF